MESLSRLHYSHCMCTRECFFFSSRRRHTRSDRDWSSDVCSSDLAGILVRAAVQDAEMLDGLGVNVPRVFTLTFAGSAALAALAGLLLAPVFTVYPQMGVEMILLAFIVVILGGMGSMGGSVIAAFVIGIAQSLLTLWMNPQRVAIAIFGIMIVVLIVRPRGFFGREGVLE